ncbi:Uncharacterised protein [Mycobacteroides abscessus subsp. abscessus]|nr:Uncharacterised protein [Mycobacteroides abscessus subsp. abscessus]
MRRPFSNSEMLPLPTPLRVANSARDSPASVRSRRSRAPTSAGADWSLSTGPL